MDTIIEVKNLCKSFKDNRVLKDLNLTIRKNDVIYIKGANGSGKSTLLKILCQLLDPDKGEMDIKKDLYTGALIENPSFVSYVSLKDNLEFLYSLRHKKMDSRRKKEIQELCQKFDLNYFSKKPIRSYSIGMKQKAGIIQAIMENQDVIFLDEPTRGLDEHSIVVFKDIMKTLKDQGKTIVVTAHDYTDIGFTRKLKLENGQIYED